MTSALRHAGRNAYICLGAMLGGAASQTWAAWRMATTGEESLATGIAFAVGGLVSILGAVMAINFIWGWRIVRGMQAGRDVIACWTVPPDAFDRFRRADAGTTRAEGPNDYEPPRDTPSGGIEVIISRDGVLIGGDFFGLASAGLSRAHGVELRPGDPTALGFGLTLTQPSGGSLTHSRSLLRLPVAPGAEEQAAAVVDHYRAVFAGRTIVKPLFWTLRIRIGVASAIGGILAAAVGLALRGPAGPVDDAGQILLGGGMILTLSGIVLALGAWSFRRMQHRR